jgi:hypothetical protein
MHAAIQKAFIVRQMMPNTKHRSIKKPIYFSSLERNPPPPDPRNGGGNANTSPCGCLGGLYHDHRAFDLSISRSHPSVLVKEELAKDSEYNQVSSSFRSW